MDAINFVKNCTSNPFKLKAITVRIVANENSLESWVNKNWAICKNVNPGDVSTLLILLAKKLMEKGASMEIVANVYTADSVIACILASQPDILANKSLANKIAKLFYQILSNSNHFTIMYKKSAMKHARTIKRAPTMPIELFWLIPMFLNPTVFNKFNFAAFDGLIEEYVKMYNLVPEFKFGYHEIVDNLSVETVENYKLFIRESVMEGNQALTETEGVAQPPAKLPA